MTGSDATVLPAALLQAVAQRNGRVTLVVGAGCSLEAPTGLMLGGVYSHEVFQQLVMDGLLDETDCSNPWDLSELAEVVYGRYGSQAHVVDRLPRAKFQFAKANDGYLLAAALIAEGAVAHVVTLNFDLALSHAVTEIQPEGVTTVAGPESYRDFGSKAIVYLHRNAYEANPEQWILRRQAIEDEWRDGWEAVVAERIAAAPVVVFAGLGSPALALTESLARVRSRIPSGTAAFLVDPSDGSAFAEAINLDEPQHHIQLGWCDFMLLLSRRLVQQFAVDLRAACNNNTPGGIDAELAEVERFTDTIGQAGLLAVGRWRAAWLGSSDRYMCDTPATRPHFADLLRGLTYFVDTEVTSVTLMPGGSVRLERAGARPVSVLPIAGRALHHWGAVDRIAAESSQPGADSPDIILAAGFRGARPPAIAPPPDITGEVPSDDITIAATGPRIVDLDALRADPSIAKGLCA